MWLDTTDGLEAINAAGLQVFEERVAINDRDVALAFPGAITETLIHLDRDAVIGKSPKGRAV